MVWTTVKTISLGSSWQYTEPVEGEYFRLKHTGAPSNGIIQIAQAEFNQDNSVTLSEAQSIETSKEFDVLEFTTPPYFANRRIAVRKVSQQSSLESQLRSLLKATLFNSSAAPSNLFPTRAGWSIGIEVSDYATPSTTVDLLPLLNQLSEVQNDIANLSSHLVEIDTQIGVIDSKISDLGNNSPPPSGMTTTLNHVSNADANGVFYWIGSSKKSTAFSNPAENGRVIASASNIFGNNATGNGPNNLVNRATQGAHTERGNPSFFKFDLTSTRSLQINYYTLRASAQTSHLPRNWKLRASNDDVTYVDLDIVVNQNTFASNTYYQKQITGITEKYRYFMIEQTGSNSTSDSYLVADEIELYGNLTEL